MTWTRKVSLRPFQLKLGCSLHWLILTFVALQQKHPKGSNTTQASKKSPCQCLIQHRSRCLRGALTILEALLRKYATESLSWRNLQLVSEATNKIMLFIGEVWSVGIDPIEWNSFGLGEVQIRTGCRTACSCLLLLGDDYQQLEMYSTRFLFSWDGVKSMPVPHLRLKGFPRTEILSLGSFPDHDGKS